MSEILLHVNLTKERLERNNYSGQLAGSIGAHQGDKLKPVKIYFLEDAADATNVSAWHACIHYLC